jgi:glucokinase
MIAFVFLFLFSTLCISATELKPEAEIKIYVEPVPTNKECLLAADIGGTKSSIGIFEVAEDETPVLLISMQADTKAIGDFNETINSVLAYLSENYGITVSNACIAAPGVATKNKDYSKVHGMFDIRTSELLEKTLLKRAIIVNDLFVVGHGLDSIDQTQIIRLYGEESEKKDKNNIRAIISAGSGIGSSMVTWDSEKKRYITHPGEAGMVTFAPTDQLEYQLAIHTRNFYGRNDTYWANLASGSGITRIYSMFKLMGKYDDSLHLDDHDPIVILKHSKNDELCTATTDLFFKLFGRFARNYVWTTLPYGGLYIVGSVAAKNPELFVENFVASYEDPQFYSYLKEIPVYLVKDSNVGLYGAVNYLLSEIKDN